MQEDFVNVNKSTQATVPLLVKILKEFRRKKLPVFHIIRSYRHDFTDTELPRVREFKEKGGHIIEGTPGAKIIKSLTPLESEYIIVKPRWSGFFMTKLPLLITRLGIKKVIIGGVQTPNCIRATAYDAVSYDLDTIVISDGTSAKSCEIHETNLLDMKNIGIQIKSCNEILRELEKV
jgi:nicotinamidase-related amidase